MAVQIRYFLESRCNFEYWQLIKTNTNIASESLAFFVLHMYLTFFNLTYFKYLYQDKNIYLQKEFSFNEVWLSKHFFYKKCFTFSRMQTLKTVKSIHSIVTRLLRYSHKNSTRCDCLSTYFLFYLIKRCLTFSKMQTLKTVKFIYSEKGTKFCEIFPLLLTACTVLSMSSNRSSISNSI